MTLTKVGAVTVTFAVPVTKPNVAEIEVVPALLACTSPEAPAVATDVLDDDHETEVVMTILLPFE